MKYFLVCLIVLLSYTSFSQELWSLGRLDTDIKKGNYYLDPSGAKINYHVVFETSFVRIEGRKVELFDSKLNKAWSLELSKVKVIDVYNEIIRVYDNGEDVYLVQTSKLINGKPQVTIITRVEKNGNKTEKIISNKKSSLRLLITEEYVYMMSSSLIGNYKYEYALQKMNFNFNFIGKEYIFESVLPNSNFCLDWFFLFYRDEVLFFVTNYYVNDDEEYTQYIEGESYSQVVKVVDVKGGQSELLVEEMVFYEKDSLELNDYLSIDTVSNINTDENLIAFIFSKQELIKNDFFKLTKLDVDDFKQDGFFSIRNYGVDVLNGNSFMFIKSYKTGKLSIGRNYYLCFDKEKLVYVREFKSKSNIENNSNKGDGFMLGVQGVFREWGSKPDTFKKNGFDFVFNHGESCQYTILSFLDYQIIFTDNKQTRTCKAYMLGAI